MCKFCETTDCIVAVTNNKINADIRFDTENKQLDLLVYQGGELILDASVDIKFCMFCGTPLVNEETPKREWCLTVEYDGGECEELYFATEADAEANIDELMRTRDVQGYGIQNKGAKHDN